MVKGHFIRPAETSDIPDLLGMIGDCGLSPWSAGALRSEIIDENSKVLVCESRDGTMAGYAHGRAVPSSKIASAWDIELLNIAVSITCRKKGLGKALLEALVTEFEHLRPANLWLEVRRLNIAAIAFYENNRFKQYGFRKGFYADPADDAILMVRDLDVHYRN